MNSVTADQVNASDVSLSEFVTLLVMQFDQQNVPMPFQNEEKWHRLFYAFKTERDVPGRPAFLNKLRFDWDGRYPKAMELSECLHTLHLNGFLSVGNPTYDTLTLDQDVRENADTVRPEVGDPQLEEFLKHSTEKASGLFRR